MYQIAPEILQNTPEWNSALFEEENIPEPQVKTPQPQTPYNHEPVPFWKDEETDTFIPKYEFEGISPEKTDARETHSVEELCDINLIELAGIGDEFSVENLTDARNAIHPIKEPVVQKTHQHAISCR